MKKILLTSAGAGTAFSYATAIAKNFPNLELFTADINAAELVTASLFSKKHFTLPLLTDESYESKLNEIIELEEIDFYLPIIDIEIKLAHQSDFLSSKLVANNNYFCSACIEKDNYHSWASGLEIKTPKLLNLEELKHDDIVVLKRNGGFGGKETEIVKVENISKFNLSGFSLSEFIKGDEFTIDCFPLESEVITTVRKRIEVKSGVCVKAEVTKNEYLSGLALKISKYFNLNQPFCFQVIKKNDDYYLIDLNPRLGAGTIMGAVTGKDYFSAHIAYILNLDIHKFLDEKLNSCIVTRQYSNYLMKTQ